MGAPRNPFTAARCGALLAALTWTAASARAEDATPDPAAAASSGEAATLGADWRDQGLGASAGVALGGGLTPGGVRMAGAYLYRLSERDWFDGAVAFTLGSDDAGCFRDRQDERVCEHGATDGFAVDFAAAVRRSWPARNHFAPFVRVGVGLRFVRFAGDSVAGLAVPLVGGGGVTADVSARTRVVASGQLELGGGLFSRGLGTGPQVGLALGLGFEVALH